MIALNVKHMYDDLNLKPLPVISSSGRWFVFILMFCLPGKLLLGQGLGTKIFNFNSFNSYSKIKSEVLDKYSSSIDKDHPEYGILPFNAPCKECVELIDKRTMCSRLFIDPKRPGHTYSQQSYFPLHYLDSKGLLRTIDYRLHPVIDNPKIFIAAYQPLPVKFDLESRFTSINLKALEFSYNHDLKLYYVKDVEGAAFNTADGDYAQYTAGDDGMRIFNIWNGIDLEAFAKEGSIETNFIINTGPAIPFAEGYLVIEDHVLIPEGYVLERAGGNDRLINEDLLLKDSSGTICARMEHVRMRNSDNQAIATPYVIEKINDGYLVKILVPLSFLNTAYYPIIIDPIVSGIGVQGNYQSTGQPSASMNFTTLPGHCDYHMNVTVPGKSQLLRAYVELEAQTTSNPFCGDTAQGLHGHICLERDILFKVVCDTCNTAQSFSCFYSNNCDTTGTLSTDPATGNGGAPLLISGVPFFSCLQPQCSDFHLGFTLQNSDSSCEDGCGQLCAKGNKWSMTIEACQVEAYLTATDTTVCQGGSTTVICHASCGVPPYHYSWSNGITGDSAVVITPTIGYNLTCTAYDACNNPVVVPPSMVINVVPLPEANAGPAKVLCNGGAVSLGATPTTANGNIVSWNASSPQALLWISDTSNNNPVVTIPRGITDSVFYFLRTYDGHCTNYDTVAVMSVPDPIATIDTSGPSIICNGKSVTLNANGSFQSYLWNNGKNTRSISASMPGIYYVIVTDNNNCKDTSNHITISVIQVPNIQAYPDTSILSGDSVKLYTNVFLSPPVVDSFFWYTNDLSIQCTNCANPYVAPSTTEEYYLIAYSNGCKITDSLIINVTPPDNFYIPNAFTPNGDGLNDVFYIYTQTGVTVDGFLVFDKLGEKVHDGPFPWNGSYKGHTCPAGVYLYVFTIRLSGQFEDVVRKGSVTLIR